MIFKKDERHEPAKRKTIQRDRSFQANMKKNMKLQRHVGDLFPEEDFEVLKSAEHGEDQTVPGSAKMLDYLVRDKKTGKSFWVECKFRQHLDGKELSWTTENQLESYKEFKKERKEPAFVVVGVGGFPSQPNEMFALPLDQAKQPQLPEHVYRQYQRQPDKKFKLAKDKLL